MTCWMKNVKDSAQCAAGRIKDKWAAGTEAELEEIHEDMEDLKAERRQDLKAFVEDNKSMLICQVVTAVVVSLAVHGLIGLCKKHRHHHWL